MKSNLKKYIFVATVAVVGSVFLSSPAFAATTISLSPTNVSVESGKQFNIALSVDPQGLKNYTVKIELNYPADILEIKTFTFGNGWMPLSQSGYDLIDNENGTMIKTAGYAGGVTSAVNFGTIVFATKNAGGGIITTTNASFALDATNNNVASENPAQISVTVTAPEVAPVVEKKVVENQDEKLVVSPIVNTTAVTEQPTTSSDADSQQIEENITVNQEQEPLVTKSIFLASIGSIITLGTGSIWMSFFVGIALSLLVGGIIYYFLNKERRKKKK